MSSSCLQGQVLFGGGMLLFILGSRLGGVGPVKEAAGLGEAKMSASMILRLTEMT